MPVTPKDIELTLKAAFPEMKYLEITDTSSGCGSSYAVIIINPTFEGKMTLARHRWGTLSSVAIGPGTPMTYVPSATVNDIMREQIKQMHAFSQKTYTPAEWERIKAKMAEEEAAKAASTE
ncbi:hypothetical protein FRC02_008041 [Tulasnella sp. 418]|nr:hypothetical protein FRC02_008041 [Tulasnella sp. 418]